MTSRLHKNTHNVNISREENLNQIDQRNIRHVQVQMATTSGSFNKLSGEKKKYFKWKSSLVFPAGTQFEEIHWNLIRKRKMISSVKGHFRSAVLVEFQDDNQTK